MALDVKLIKKLREETGAGVLDVKLSLEKHKGDVEAVKKELMAKGLAQAAKKSQERITKDGLIHAYIHAGGKVGSMIHVACETDFVAKTEAFSNLCHEIALQVATTEYDSVDELLKDEYIRDSTKTISTVIDEVIAKVGEKIEVKQIIRFSVK